MMAQAMLSILLMMVLSSGGSAFNVHNTLLAQNSPSSNHAPTSPQARNSTVTTKPDTTDFQKTYARSLTLVQGRGTWQWLLKIKYYSWFWIRRHLLMGRKMTKEERKITEIYKKTLPSVGQLIVVSEPKDLNLTEGGKVIDVSTSNAILWDKKGHLVTNWHCLYADKGNLTAVKVKFPGVADALEVDVVGFLRERDLAVLKVREPSKESNPQMKNPLKALPKPIRKGQSGNVQVGQTCLSISQRGSNSYPASSLGFGTVCCLDLTVSPRGRDDPSVELNIEVPCCIETIGDLGPGSSGGPLLDTQGKLIGIKFCGDGLSSKSVPIDTVKGAVRQIIQNGHAKFATAGFQHAQTSRIKVQLVLSKESSIVEGAMITHVDPNGPAERAGLQEISYRREGAFKVEPRDIVVAVDGQEVASSDVLTRVMEGKMPGETIVLTLSRVDPFHNSKRFLEVIPIKLTSFEEINMVSKEQPEKK